MPLHLYNTICDTYEFSGIQKTIQILKGQRLSWENSEQLF